MHDKRIRTIDICKGIGIILIVFGHRFIGELQPYAFILYSFHIPLFFFLSGMVLNTQKYKSLTVLLKKKIKTIVIPYFVLAFITYFLHLSPPLHINTYSPTHEIMGILYGSGNGDYSSLTFNIVLWYLPCLFVVILGFEILRRYLSGYLRIVTLVMCSLVGYAFGKHVPPLSFPWGIEIALTGIVFYGIGYALKDLVKKSNSFFDKKKPLLFLILAGVSIEFAYINMLLSGGSVDIRVNMLGNYFLFYIAAFSGILSVLIMSNILKKNELLEYLGKNSFIIFAWHWMVFSYMEIIFQGVLDVNTIAKISSPIIIFSDAILSTILCIGIILLMNNVIKRLRKGIKYSRDTRHSLF